MHAHTARESRQTNKDIATTRTTGQNQAFPIGWCDRLVVHVAAAPKLRSWEQYEGKSPRPQRMDSAHRSALRLRSMSIRLDTNTRARCPASSTPKTAGCGHGWQERSAEVRSSLQAAK